jgi:hypothetical protein
LESAPWREKNFRVAGTFVGVFILT